MDVIDEEGQILGVVNVVDALVVLFVLGLAVAGSAVLFSDSEGPTTEGPYVTLDLGTQPAFVIEELNEGDTYSPTSNSQITITDVHLTPQSDNTKVTLRAKLEGTMNDDGIVYDGAPPRLGRTLTISTNRYEVEGEIRAVGEKDNLARVEPTVVLRDTIAASEARALSVGDEIRVGDRIVATVEDLAVYTTEDPDQRIVYVQTTLIAHRQRGQARFGGQPIRLGQTVTLPNAGYTITGTIERVGGGLERGDIDILLEKTVDIETADRLAEGDTAIVSGKTIATIEHVEMYGTENPERKRAFIGLSLETVGHGERPMFGTTPIQTGRSITIRTPEYTLSGSVERVGHLQQRGAPATRTVTIRMEGIREEFASTIKEGMVERVDGGTVAKIIEVQIEPTTVIVTSDRGNLSVHDHPYNRDVTITAELQVRETTTGTRFKGQPIQQQDTITLDLNSVTVRGTIIRIR